MPLQLLLEAKWSQRYSWEHSPKIITVCRVVAIVSTLVCWFFVLWQLCRERYYQWMSPAKRITANFSIRMVRQIIFVPILLSTISMLSLYFPAQAYGLDLTISIGAVLQVSGVLWHCLDAFGSPPKTEVIVSKLPPRRWWCGSSCGGFADAMPYLACICGQRKEAKKITMTQLQIAYYGTQIWIWVTILNASYGLTWASWPKHMEQRGKWCFAVPEMPKGHQIFVTTIGIWSGLFGMSCFGVLAGAASLAIHREGTSETSKQVRSRFNLAQVYVSLPILKSLLYAIPMGFENPTVKHFTPFNTTKYQWTENYHFPGALDVGMPAQLSSDVEGMIYTCPLYDKEVMNLIAYATVVAILMGWLAYKNWRLNPIECWSQALRAQLSNFANNNNNPHMCYDSEDGSENLSEEPETSEASDAAPAAAATSGEGGGGAAAVAAGVRGALRGRESA